MKIITINKIKQLVKDVTESDNPCVTIYVDTAKRWRNSGEAKIEFKNKLDKAKELLEDREMRGPIAGKLLRKSSVLLDEDSFWKDRREGFALFAFRKGKEYVTDMIDLPFSPESSAYVGELPYLKPLIPALSEKMEFFLLAISQNSVKLYKGSGDKISQITDTIVPKDIGAALSHDDPEKSMQHEESKPATGKGAGSDAVFHGHGSFKDSYKENVTRYLQKIDRKMAEEFKNETAPLVVACVEWLFPIYKDNNSYQNLCGEFLAGNPDRKKQKQLLDGASKLVKKENEKARQDAIAQFNDQFSTDRVTTDLESIVRASFQGRVDILFLDPYNDKYGHYIVNEDLVEIDTGDVELLNYCAVHTILNDGKVFAMTDRQKKQNNSLVAAILRF